MGPPTRPGASGPHYLNSALPHPGVVNRKNFRSMNISKGSALQEYYLRVSTTLLAGALHLCCRKRIFYIVAN